jgi:hypothetical protein
MAFWFSRDYVEGRPGFVWHERTMACDVSNSTEGAPPVFQRQKNARVRRVYLQIVETSMSLLKCSQCAELRFAMLFSMTASLPCTYMTNRPAGE